MFTGARRRVRVDSSVPVIYNSADYDWYVHPVCHESVRRFDFGTSQGTWSSTSRAPSQLPAARTHLDAIRAMSELATRLLDDLKASMRASQPTRRDTLRFLRAEIHNAEIDRGRTLSDDEIVAIIRRQIKQRRDSIEQFARGNRQDLVQAESDQIEILQSYLPPEMSHDELLAIAREAVAEVGATNPRDLGKLMPALRSRVGSRADGAAIANAAREALSTAAGAESGTGSTRAEPSSQ